MIRHRRVRVVAVFAASATVLALSPVVAGAQAAGTSVATVKAPKCFGKKPGYVLTGAHAKLTLTSKTKNAVVDLLGKGETLNAGKAKGNTYVCDTGGARSITTGNGNDKVSIKGGSPSVSTGNGNDTFIQTGTGNPVVHLGAGNDVGTLGKGNGTLYGDAGNDVLRAGTGTTGKHGRQHLVGGAGNDTLYAGKATATLDGSNPGTHYVVPTAYAPHTTVILRAGDTLNGQPYPTPKTSTPTPTAPSAPPAPPLPTGTIVAFAQDSGLNNEVLANQVIDFTTTGVAGAGRSVTAWSIGYGDGSAGTHGVGLPPTQVDHVYNTVGSYTATLALTDDLGRTATFPASIDVAGAPSADFTLSDATQTSLTVTGTFTGGAGAHAHLVMSSIDYGDGSDPTMTSGAPGAISHLYPRPGTYLIDITVSDDHGGDDSETQTVAITTSAPQAYLTSQRTPVGGSFTGVVGSYDVTFLAGTSVPATGQTISSLSLDPGDGSGFRDITSSGEYLASYTASGTYIAELDLVQTNKTATSKSAPVYIAPNNGSATITGPSTATVGSPVTFTLTQQASTPPSGSGVPADTITQRTVDFGYFSESEAIPTGNTVTHTFTAAGDYVVSYEVDDSYGGTYTDQSEIIVSASTPSIVDAGFGGENGDFSPWVGVPANTATDIGLSALGSTGHVAGATYRIDYGDGSTPDTGTLSGSGSPVDSMGNRDYLYHTYTTPGGEYTATTTVTDSAGLTTTFSQHVSVAGSASFTLGTATRSGSMITIPVTAYSPGADAEPDYYSYSIDNSGGSKFQEGYVNGGLPGTVTIPVDSYLGPAPYHVTLSAINDHDGEQDSFFTVN